MERFISIDRFEGNLNRTGKLNCCRSAYKNPFVFANFIHKFKVLYLHHAGLVLEIASSDRHWEMDERRAKIRCDWCFGREAFADELLERLAEMIGKRGAAIRTMERQPAATTSAKRSDC